MGGYGSGQWRWRSAKTCVEDTHKLHLREFRKYLRAGGSWTGSIRWTRGGKPNGNIGYVTIAPDTVRLIYTVNQGKPDAHDYDYPVRTTTTQTAFGGTRLWWLCPRCGRRCDTLYLRSLFLCRHCQGLTYRSCQESHSSDRVYALVAAHMGVSLADVRETMRYAQKHAGENPYARPRKHAKRW